MLPANYYIQRISDLQSAQLQLLRKKRLLGWSRFATIALLVGGVYFLWPQGWITVTIFALVSLVIFTRLLLTDLRNNKAIETNRNLISVNEDETKALAHHYFHFDDGAAHQPIQHLYANDLDIFGRASLFQYLNRTGSQMGSAVLANWLLAPAATDLLLQRQDAVKELTANTEWRQHLQALGKQKSIQNATLQQVQQWLNEPNGFTAAYWKWISVIFPAIVLIIIGLNITGVIPYQIRNMALLLFAVIAFFIAKKAAPVYLHLSKIVGELDVLSESMQLIETLQTKTALLVTMQTQFLQKDYKASTAVKELKKILERIELRNNPVVFVPLAVLLQWDLQQVLQLEKWKQRHHQHALLWFNMLAQFEALSSFATLSFNHPQWCFPEFKQPHFFIESSQMGHPLINASKRVNNDISISHSGEIMVITGSNMAGKSTYLRSVGINTVLAMAGAPVCAESFTLSPVQVISSMRID